MDLIEKFIRQVSYKFPKGYPDMNDEQDVQLLNTLLEGLDIDLNEIILTKNSIINSIINAPESKGKLGPHSRPGRIKNIGNINDNDFIDILSNVFNIDTKDIKVLPPKSIGNPSSKNSAFRFPIEGQEMTVVLGTEARGTNIEDYELSGLNDVIKQNGGSINIKVGDETYENITKVEKIPGNKQADFIFVGKDNLYIQHKDLKASQQLSGVKKLESNPEVKDFVQTVKEISGGSLQSKMNFKRKVASPELQIDGAYGVGNKFGIDKVQSIIFGNITLKPSPDNPSYFELSGPVQFNYPEPLTGDYALYLFATYRSYGINQQGIKNCRVGFYPLKYYPTAKEV